MSSTVAVLDTLPTCYQPLWHAHLISHLSHQEATRYCPPFSIICNFACCSVMYQKADEVRIFPLAPHLETIIPSPACSQVEDHLSMLHGGRWLCCSIRQQWYSWSVQLEGSCKHSFWQMKLVVAAGVGFFLRAMGWAGRQEDIFLDVGLSVLPRQFRISFLWFLYFGIFLHD